MRSAKSYQREIRTLKAIIRDAQWVCPAYNGNDSCSGCGNPRHIGCAPDCDVAKVTGNFGKDDGQ